VLDDAVELYRVLRRQYRRFYYSSRVQKKMYRWQTVAWCTFWLTLSLAGYDYGWPQFRWYQETHYARQAEQLLADGDVNRAMIRSRQVLSLNLSNAIATRVLADVADSYGSPAALFWRQRALLLAPDVTNQIALASTAVRLEQFLWVPSSRPFNKPRTTSAQRVHWRSNCPKPGRQRNTSSKHTGWIPTTR
jgi:hypothetical protein